VHEQDAQLRVPGAGIYIWENGLRVLETLGVLDAVSAGAIPASRHEKRDADGRPFAASGFAPDWRLIVPLRRTLLTALADALVAAGGELVFDSAPSRPCRRGGCCSRMGGPSPPIWSSARTGSIRGCGTRWGCWPGAGRWGSSATG
jgi:hypothetical protein